VDKQPPVPFDAAGVLRVQVDGVGVVGQGAEVEEENCVWSEGVCELGGVGD
jgi:hypothetical protein